MTIGQVGVGCTTRRARDTNAVFVVGHFALFVAQNAWVHAEGHVSGRASDTFSYIDAVCSGRAR